MVALNGEAVFGDGNVKVFGELVAVFDAADGASDLVPSRATAAMGDLVSASLLNAASVARSRSSRLRARCSANSGFLQTTRRSPGKSGAVISARSRSSNSESWKAPVSSSARICGALNAVIQSSPAGLSSSPIRALVIIPRSPPAPPASRYRMLQTLAAESVWNLLNMRGQ